MINEAHIEKVREHSAKVWLTITRTRPMWGMIPLRIIFGVTLILEGFSRFTFARHHTAALLSQLPNEWAFALVVFFSVVEIIAGLLMLWGFLVRFAGLALLVEMSVAIFLERIPLAFSRDLQTQILIIGVASLMVFSGAGRYSIDRHIAKKILKKRPIKKWELYCYAETPYTKWWE